MGFCAPYFFGLVLFGFLFFVLVFSCVHILPTGQDRQEYDRQNRTDRTGQAEQRQRWQKKRGRTGQEEQDMQNMTSRTRQADGTSRTGLAESTCTGQAEQDK